MPGEALKPPVKVASQVIPYPVGVALSTSGTSVAAVLTMPNPAGVRAITGVVSDPISFIAFLSREPATDCTGELEEVSPARTELGSVASSIASTVSA